MLPTYLSRALLLCAALAAATACSKQGEGERCDANSGNLDCENGLVCRTADQLNIVGTGALCCPVDTVSSTVDACRTNPDLPLEPMPPPAPVADAGTQPPPPPTAGDAGDGGL